MKLLETILNNETYKEEQYRYDDFKEAIQEKIQYEDNSGISNKKEMMCVHSLNQYFEKNAKKWEIYRVLIKNFIEILWHIKV